MIRPLLCIHTPANGGVDARQAERMLRHLDSGAIFAARRPGYAEFGLRCTDGPCGVVSRSVCSLRDEQGEEPDQDIVITVVRDALSLAVRTGGANPSRAALSNDILNMATRLAAAREEMPPSRSFNAQAATPTRPQAFGPITSSEKGWSASMRDDHERQPLPAVLTMVLHGMTGIHIRRHSIQVKDLYPMEPMQHLHAERRLADLLAQAAELAGS